MFNSILAMLENYLHDQRKCNGINGQVAGQAPGIFKSMDIQFFSIEMITEILTKFTDICYTQYTCLKLYAMTDF